MSSDTFVHQVHVDNRLGVIVFVIGLPQPEEAEFREALFQIYDHLMYGEVDHVIGSLLYEHKTTLSVADLKFGRFLENPDKLLTELGL